MAQSPEYPDLKWMQPKSWTNANRTSVQVVIIHDTEGSETATSAEDGASYDQRRTDGTSTHYFHDRNSTVQCVRTEDQAHAARAQGNRRGIQHELCGKASQGAAGWADAASAGTLRQAARQVARDCRKWKIPAVKLTASQVAAGHKGICGHADITKAFPADHGTHTDPGPTFPWTKFIDMVQAELNPPKGPTVATQFNADDLAAIRLQSQLGVYDAFQRASAASDATPGGDDATGRQIRDFFNNMFDFASDLGPITDNITAMTLKVDTIDENTAGLVKDPADGGPSAQQQNLKTALS